MAESPSKLLIGGHRVDLDAHRIRRPDGWVQVKPRSVAVLEYLIRHAGKVCSRRDIMDGVWAQVEVSEEVLNQAIHELRGAFGDDPRKPRFIETIPRGGYRLIADIEEDDSGARSRISLSRAAAIAGAIALIAAVALWLTAGQQASDSPVKRLAVLPFEIMGPEDSFDYFADGLTEELITELNAVNPERLDVIARTSVMAFKGRRVPLTEIVDQLAVNYIVEGSVRREADRVRITAQLIETEGQTHVWAESFDRRIENILVLQREVAREIARQAEVPLAGFRGREPRRVDPEAYRHFLRGRQQIYRFHSGGYAAGVDEFDAALEREPEYAAVHGWRGMAYSALAFSASSPVRRREYAELGRASAERALELDRQLGVAHAVIAWQTFAHDWDFARAERLYRDALEIDPNNWWLHWGYAELLSALGRHDEAIARINKAQEIDPVNPLVEVERTAVYNHAGQYQKALKVVDRALEVMPNHQELHDRRVGILEHLNRFAQAIDARERYGLVVKREYDAAAHRKAWQEHGERGYWQWLLENPGWKTGRISRARVRARLGHEAEALDLLAQAIQERRPASVYIGVFPEFRSLANRPRFQQLLQKIGLPSDPE